MQTWVYAVLFCALLAGIGLLVDRRARAVRKGLERPADTRGRSKAEPVGQARVDNPGAAGIAQRMEGGTGGSS
ncbi:hypothetical protein ACQPW3_34235 [Actinosynnema sp. CA-248983]